MASSDRPPFYDDDEGTAQIRISQLPSPIKSSEHPYLIVYGGDDAGRMIPITDELTVGRSRQAGLPLTGEGVSRIHARLFRKGGQTFVEDLGSTNGTRLNGDELQAAAILKDGDHIQVGVNLILKFSLQDEAQVRFQQQLYEAALRDPLTKAYNRRALLERLETDLSFSLRHGSPLALLLFDLDRFKQVNDTYGHLAGDHVLREFALVVGGTVRKEDMFARYGGEEFAMVCRSTDITRGTQLAERIRGLVEDRTITHDGQRIPVTVSVGVACAWPEATVDGLIQRADDMLFLAKDGGRNRVVFHP